MLEPWSGGTVQQGPATANKDLKLFVCREVHCSSTLNRVFCRVLRDSVARIFCSLTRCHRRQICGPVSPTPGRNLSLVLMSLASMTPLAIGKTWFNVDLQSLFELDVHSCTHWLRPRNPTPPHLGSYTRALLASQDKRHIFVTSCL